MGKVYYNMPVVNFLKKGTENLGEYQWMSQDIFRGDFKILAAWFDNHDIKRPEITFHCMLDYYLANTHTTICFHFKNLEEEGMFRLTFLDRLL
jgi:hypothetical protein